VIEKTSLLTISDLDNLKLADSYARRNYRVVLSLNADVIQGGDTQARAGGLANHFVVLSGPIDFGPPARCGFTLGVDTRSSRE
jgi:hypothetical protein